MIGRLLCYLWAHRWQYAQANGHGYAVLFCTRCAKGRIGLRGLR